MVCVFQVCAADRDGLLVFCTGVDMIDRGSDLNRRIRFFVVVMIVGIEMW